MIIFHIFVINACIKCWKHTCRNKIELSKYDMLRVSLAFAVDVLDIQDTMTTSNESAFNSRYIFSIFTEPPQPTKKCPRRNGFFAHPDPSVCNIFYNCIDGEAIEITCTTGLHFDEYSGTCVWPDSAGREVNVVLYFTCIIYFFF